jgi:hypothetical protein
MGKVKLTVLITIIIINFVQVATLSGGKQLGQQICLEISPSHWHNSIKFNSMQFFIINVPSLQQNAIYRNNTLNICRYISVLQHNIWLEHVMYRARIKNKQM